VEGTNIALEYRFAEGNIDRLADLVAELLAQKVDVILVTSTAPAVAAKAATRTTPIVMATSADPVESGLVASLAKPGGNITGLSFSVGLQVVGKELELLVEAVPSARQGIQAGRPAHRTADQVRARAQPQDREGARPRDPAVGDGPPHRHAGRWRGGHGVANRAIVST
jgi:hypothetical protein